MSSQGFRTGPEALKCVTHQTSSRIVIIVCSLFKGKPGPRGEKGEKGDQGQKVT